MNSFSTLKTNGIESDVGLKVETKKFEELKTLTPNVSQVQRKQTKYKKLIQLHVSKNVSGKVEVKYLSQNRKSNFCSL